MILAIEKAKTPHTAQRAMPTASDYQVAPTPEATAQQLARNSQEPPRPQSAGETDMLETARNGAKNKILAIEDDPEVLALYKSYLQKRGYEVLSAAGAVEGMSLLKDNPDTRLILLDLNLPGMSGEEWIAWYVQQGKQTPVVVASGKGDILTITKGNAMTAALTKPFHMEELQELIEVLLADDWHEQVSVDKKLH
jgi:CheY-like chemotaxis protein